MATLLSVNHQDDGYTQLVYDIGVDKRATLLVKTEDVQTILEIPADDVIGDVLDPNRAVERKPGKS